MLQWPLLSSMQTYPGVSSSLGVCTLSRRLEVLAAACQSHRCSRGGSCACYAILAAEYVAEYHVLQVPRTRSMTTDVSLQSLCSATVVVYGMQASQRCCGTSQKGSGPNRSAKSSGQFLLLSSSDPK